MPGSDECLTVGRLTPREASMTVEQRLAKLERSAKVWRALSLALLAVLCVAAVQEEPRVHPPKGAEFGYLKARQLVLVDNQGKERIYLGVNDLDDRVALELCSVPGKPGIQLDVDSDGTPNISLRDRQTKSKVLIGMTTKHQAHVMVTDGSGKLIDRMPER